VNSDSKNEGLCKYIILNQRYLNKNGSREETIEEVYGDKVITEFGAYSLSFFRDNFKINSKGA